MTDTTDRSKEGTYFLTLKVGYEGQLNFQTQTFMVDVEQNPCDFAVISVSNDLLIWSPEQQPGTV